MGAVAVAEVNVGLAHCGQFGIACVAHADFALRGFPAKSGVDINDDLLQMILVTVESAAPLYSSERARGVDGPWALCPTSTRDHRQSDASPDRRNARSSPARVDRAQFRVGHSNPCSVDRPPHVHVREKGKVVVRTNGSPIEGCASPRKARARSARAGD
jgi:hypothetical protein